MNPSQRIPIWMYNWFPVRSLNDISANLKHLVSLFLFYILWLAMVAKFWIIANNQALCLYNIIIDIILFKILTTLWSRLCCLHIISEKTKTQRCYIVSKLQSQSVPVFIILNTSIELTPTRGIWRWVSLFSVLKAASTHTLTHTVAHTH